MVISFCLGVRNFVAKDPTSMTSLDVADAHVILGPDASGIDDKENR
jgi:hypothetical protein